MLLTRRMWQAYSLRECMVGPMVFPQGVALG